MKYKFDRLNQVADQLESIAASLQEPVRRGRGTKISKLSGRVFICWDKKDTQLLGQLASDILSQDIGVDCVVSYYDMFQKLPDDETITNELRDTQLVVLLVTASFLQKSKQNDLREFLIAKELNRQYGLSILPVAVHDGLFHALTINENAVHGVAMKDLEYRQKLGAQLANFVADTDVIRQISAKAFCSRLFLSYRKKDINAARTLIQDFHNVSGLNHVAVWYDNYLTAGRIFDQEIRDAIDDSSVFVLLVTPTLFEKNAEGQTNYVLAQEIPYAIKSGKKIVAVEATPISQAQHAQFESICPDCDAYLAMDQLDTFLILLQEELASFVPNDEQQYLLGMAYRWGILVEHNPDFALNLFEAVNDSVSIWGIKATIEEIRLWNSANINISYTQSLALWYQAIETQKQVLGENHPDIAVSCNNLAVLLQSHDDFDGALQYYQTALAINEKNLSFDHAAVAINYDNIGKLYSDIGNYADALFYLEKALIIHAKEGTDNLPAANTYNSMAIAYKRQGDYKKALKLYEKAYEINKKILGPDGQKTIITLDNIAALYLAQGKSRKALKAYYQILEIQKKAYGLENPGIAQTCTSIAYIHNARRDYTQALDWLEEARKIQEALFMDAHPDLAKTYSLMGVSYAMQGDHPQGAIWNQKAIELYSSYLMGGETLDLAWFYGNSAAVAICRGDSQEELKCYEKILAIQENILGAEHPQTLETLRAIENHSF